MGLTARSFDVLAAFTPDRPTLTLTELSRATGLPLTTTHRIVGELLEWGALERRDDGGLQIGLRLWRVASLAPRGLGLREQALPFMEDLFVATGENVQLAVREGREAVFLERLAGRRSVKVLTRVGDRFALHATGVGLVLLAHAPAPLQDEVLASPLEAWTDWTITDPKALRRVLAEVRRTGRAISDRQVTPDAVSVAAPVRGPSRGVVAALSVVVRRGSVAPEALVPAVVAAAHGISRTLGAEAD
ncbi:MAG: IclR family transcriptional regulator [Candidatus Nanopelagicales bacterium]